MLSGSGVATAINFLYNILVARFLGPQGFGNATAVYTLLVLISAITLSFQIVSAKIVAQQTTNDGKYAGYRYFHHGAWGCGAVMAFFLLLFHSSISNYLKLADPLLVVLLAGGVAFYVPLGSRRGYLQGAYGFRSLAVSLVLEGAVRLGGSLLLILMGLGVRGVIAANSAAVAIAYFAIFPRCGQRLTSPLGLRPAMREMSQAIVFFSGQVLINNCDIVLVKHFFLAEAAGLYAVVAMVGRVIFALSQAVVNSMFPLVAGTREEERKDLTVIATSLFMVLGLGCGIAIVLRIAPPEIWKMLFGARFQIPGPYTLSYLLALYALMSVIYCLSAVVITYEMSYKIANTSWVQLVFSGVVIAGICRFHASLREVILVQLVLMIGLLVLVGIPFLAGALANQDRNHLHRTFAAAKIVRRVSEDEVIAEILRSDFHNSAFRHYQQLFDDMVYRPNLSNANENATRRALFFVRHKALWNELPSDTVWQELEMTEAGLEQVRVFPRGQWRNLARGSFSILDVAQQFQSADDMVDTRLQTKIREIRERMVREDASTLGTVILIGMHPSSSLTVLDGNHRLVAAMTGPPGAVQRLRFVCGFSPKMRECCWYNSNVGTLLRYGKNVLLQGRRNPREELARLMQSSG